MSPTTVEPRFSKAPPAALRIARKKAARTSASVRQPVDPHIDQHRAWLHHLGGDEPGDAHRHHQDVRLAACSWARSDRVTVADRHRGVLRSRASCSHRACPTMFDRPTTTACLSEDIGNALDRRRISMTPAGVHGTSPGGAGSISLPSILRMKAVDVLVRQRPALSRLSWCRHARGSGSWMRMPSIIVAAVQVVDQRQQLARSSPTLVRRRSVSLWMPSSPQVFTLLRT